MKNKQNDPAFKQRSPLLLVYMAMTNCAVATVSLLVYRIHGSLPELLRMIAVLSEMVSPAPFILSGFYLIYKRKSTWPLWTSMIISLLSVSIWAYLIVSIIKGIENGTH